MVVRRWRMDVGIGGVPLKKEKRAINLKGEGE
jgi:hypothetical protein